MVTIATTDSLAIQAATSPAKTDGQASTSASTSFASTLEATKEAAQETAKTSPADEEKPAVTTNEKNQAPLTLEYLLAALKGTNETEEKEQTIDLSTLFQVTDTQQLTELLGGQPLVEGEQLTLENVAAAIGMTTAELQQLLTKLTDATEQSTTVWDALSKVDAKLTSLLQEIALAVNGHADAKLTKKEAQQAISFLKIVELAAPKTDLTLKQEMLSSQTKNWLATLTSQITAKTTEKEVVLPFAKQAMRFQLSSSTTEQTTSTVTNQQPTISRQQTVTIQLPTTSTASQAAKFVEEFQTVMNRAQLASNAAGTRMLIKLYPENLGTIRIELVQKDGVLSAKLLASTSLGKQLLDGSLQQLKHGLASQNIQLDRLDVTQALTEPAKSDRGHQFGQQSSNQSEADKEEQAKLKEEQKTFDELLNELEE